MLIVAYFLTNSFQGFRWILEKRKEADYTAFNTTPGISRSCEYAGPEKKEGATCALFLKTERIKHVTDKKGKETNETPMEAFNEASQALAESLSATQERNLKYAQSVFESTMALLRDHAESARKVLK